MSTEKESQANGEIKKGEKRENHYIYFPGATATQQGMALIENELKRSFGVNNVDVHSSIISTDHQGSEKLENEANRIYKLLFPEEDKDRPKDIKIIAHSLGAVELSKIIRLLIKDCPAQTLNERVEIILVSPFGFATNLKEKMRMLKRVFKRMGPIPTGIISLSLLPIEGITGEELSGYLHQALPDFSSQEESLKISTFETDGEGYVDLSKLVNMEILKSKVTEIDEELKSAIESENWDVFRTLLKKRAKVLKKDISQAFSGEGIVRIISNDNEDEIQDESIAGNNRTMLKNLLNLVKNKRGRSFLKSSMNREVYRTFLYLKAQGMKISFLVPEFDVILPFDEVLQVFQDLDGIKTTNTENIEVLGNSGHESAAIRSTGLVDLLKKIFLGEN